MWKKILGGATVGGILIVLAVFLYFESTQETQELNEETRREIAGQFIKLSGGYVHYELAGPDTGATVILIHGAGSGYYAWDNNFNALAQNGFRVLRYDLYGRGFSDRPKVAYDTILFYNQLTELIDSLHLKPPFSIAAVSMGSTIGIHFAKNKLGEVKNLILTDPASLSDGKLPWFIKTPVVSSLLMTVYWYPRAVEKQMREYYNPSNVPEYREKSWNQLRYKGLKQAMLSSWQHVLPLNMTSNLEKIGKSDTRVLLVWGKYDPLVPPKTSEHYLKAMPQAKYVEIDSAGHLSNYERPDMFNPAVTNFLRNEE